MKKTVSLLLSMVIFITVLGPLGGTAPVYAQDGEGALPESMYLQPPVGECSGCGEPVFAREGRWAEDSRCYTCWAIDRNKHSLVTWTPPVPYCTHCDESTLGNTSGFCDDCIKAACGQHTQTVLVQDKETGKPLEGALVTGGALQAVSTDASGKATKSEPYMHLNGNTALTVSCAGYQGTKQEVSVLDLSQTVTVELQRLPDTFTVPIQAVEFAAEAFGPVILDTEAEFESLPFPIAVKNLVCNEVTLKRDTETGNYTGSFQMDGLAQLLFEGEPTIRGEVTARWDEREARLELLSANVNGSLTFSGNVNWGLMGLDGDLPVQIQLTGKQGEDGRLELVPRIRGSGSVYAYLGVKLEKPVKFGRLTTKLGAEASGGVLFHLQAEMANGVDILQDFVQLTGNLQAKVKLLGWEKVWPGFYWQYYPVVEDGDYEIPEPIERFPGRSETGTDSQDSQKFHPDAAPVTPKPDGKPGTPVVEDSGSSADPILLPAGGGSVVSGGRYQGPAVMFWLQDAAERQEMDRHMLVYSLYDGNRWSDPAPVHDDGTADYAPRAVTAGETVYLIWQNADKEFSGSVSSAEYALSMDIYAAVIKDGQIREITNLTEGIPGYCGMHDLTVQDGKAAAVWAANDKGDLLFSQGTNQAYEAVYEDGEWTVSSAGTAAGVGTAAVQLLAAAENPGETDEDFIEAAGTRFYSREDGAIACMVDGREQVIIPEANTASFAAATNGELVFLYWLRAGQDGAFRLNGAFYNSDTGVCSQAQTYLDHGTALHGISASVDRKGTVLMAYQASEWQDIQSGTYQSSDLLAAVISPPEAVTGGRGWIWILVVAGTVVAAAGIAAVWLLAGKRRSQRSRQPEGKG